MMVGSPTLPGKQSRIARSIWPYRSGLVSPVNIRMGNRNLPMVSRDRDGLASGRSACWGIEKSSPCPSHGSGKVMAKADREDAIMRGKRRDLKIPASIVVHRTMHQHERRPAAALLVSHRISVHLDRLDAFRQRPSAYYCHGQRPYARRGRHSNSKLSCALAHPLLYEPFGGRVWVKSRHCKVIGAGPFYTRKME